MIISIKDTILEMCDKMEKERAQNEEEGNDLILPDVIDNLQGGLANLGQQATIEIPRCTKNID